MRSLLVAATVFLVSLPSWSDSPPLSGSPRELGLAVLRELAIAAGTITIRVDSNGCTTKASFRASVVSGESPSARVPHYRVRIERIAVDECKAMVWEGVSIEFDLQKDLGLSGAFTLSVDNPVSVRIQEKAGR